MRFRTKIVSTIGPSVESFDKMVALMKAGVSVARLNFSHGTHEEHLKNILNLKKARDSLGKPLAIMLDTKGPKIRLGKLPDEGLSFQPKDRLTLVEEGRGDLQKRKLELFPSEVISALDPGKKVLFDDGYLVGEVISVDRNEALIEIENEGILKTGKGVSLPGTRLPLSALTEKDLADLKFGAEHDIDYVAASFIRSAEHILSIKEFLAKQNKSDILVIAKIESTEGVDNFDNIVQVADGIMVARGDLGVEIDLALVPKLQKMMIRKCFQASKPVITATQMLESMIHNPRPTRAEVSDVANAIYDSTSLVMLSAETAVGKYPIETVERMASIIRETENDFNFRAYFEQHSKKEYHDISSSVALAAVKTGYAAGASAIFAFTVSGSAARYISRLRPDIPILAVTPFHKTYQQLALNWGVYPVLAPGCHSAREAFQAASQYGLKEGLIAFGDIVVVTAGIPFGEKGSTNMMMVQNIGEILVRGERGFGPKVSAKVMHLLSTEGKDPHDLEGKIVVISRCDHDFLACLKEAKGVIVENGEKDSISEQYAVLLAKTFSLSVITRAVNAMAVLKEGEEVTLDPQKGLVYRGDEGLTHF